MGNCTALMHSLPKDKCRVLIYNGGEEEFTASTRVKKITTGPYNGYKLVHHAQPHLPLPPNTKLKSGEVYYLMPNLTQPPSPLVSHKMMHDNSSRGRIVKIAVTKQQFELLLRDAKKFQSNGKAVQFIQRFCARNECRKWRPSLATIPELQNLLD